MQQVGHLGRERLTLRVLLHAGVLRDGGRSTVGGDVDGPHPLSHVARERAGGFDDLVELKVQVAGVGPDDVPVRLLTLKMQFDQVASVIPPPSIPRPSWN